MKHIPKNIEQVIEEFSKLPGIGPKSAERLTFYLLRKTDSDVLKLGESIKNLKVGIQFCKTCSNFSTEELCEICKSGERNEGVICVVEEALDLIAVEKTSQYKGLYHVLHGIISPVNGIGPDELKIAELIERVKIGNIKEIILALNPSIEGEATAAYIVRSINDPSIKITRLARGIPVGGDLEYADSQTLKQAMEGRIEY